MVNCASAPVTPFYRDATPINVDDRAAISKTVIPTNAITDFKVSGLLAVHLSITIYSDRAHVITSDDEIVRFGR
jgi:hypothetical protein